jgi:hypothetical protein
LTKKNLPIKHEELNEEGMNYVEIREDFDEQEEAKLNEITDKTSKIHIDMNKEDKKKKEFSAEDEAIFEMLKQAELEEEMENKKKKENEYEDFIKSLKEYDQENEKDVKGKKRVDSDSEDNEEEEEEEEEENHDNINFEHLKEKFKLYKEKEIQKMKQEEKENKIFEDIDNKKENTNDSNNNNTFMDMSQIKNPADIYRHIYNINEQAKKNKEILENEKKTNESPEVNIKMQNIQDNNNNNTSSSISNTNTPISSIAVDNNTKLKENSYISQIKPKIPKKKKSSLFKSHMMEQRKKQGDVEKDIVELKPVKDVIRPIERQVVTGGVKSIVQEHNVNNDYKAPTPKKNRKISYFKRMAEAQYSSNDENQNQNSNKNIKNVPVMQNTIKENPNNTALDEDEIDFYFTQREANQEYQKRKYQKSLIAKEKPLDEYDENNN